MTVNPSSDDKTVVRSARTNAIIAALATVLAAVIAAAGVIIASNSRTTNKLEGSVGDLQIQLRNKTQEAETLANTIKQLRAKLERLGQGTSEETDLGPAVQVEDGFQFELHKCTRTGTNVTCTMTITNSGTTRDLRLHARPDLIYNSRALDDQGNQLQSDGAILAGISEGLPRMDLPPRVPVKASIRFRDVPPEVKRFAVLHLGFEIEISDRSIEFRDVEIAAA